MGILSKQFILALVVNVCTIFSTAAYATVVFTSDKTAFEATNPGLSSEDFESNSFETLRLRAL